MGSLRLASFLYKQYNDIETSGTDGWQVDYRMIHRRISLRLTLLQGLLLCLVTLAAKGSTVDLTFDLGKIEETGAVLQALLNGKNCSATYPQCGTDLSLVPDSTNPACFYVCNLKGRDCRACCGTGQVFSPQGLLGSCKASAVLYAPSLTSCPLQ